MIDPTLAELPMEPQARKEIPESEPSIPGDDLSESDRKFLLELEQVLIGSNLRTDLATSVSKHPSPAKT